MTHRTTPAPPQHAATRLVVGCMTGTSIDALDAALVEIQGSGLAMRARFLRGHSRALGPLANGLRRLAEQEPLTAGEISVIARDFALLHVDAIETLLNQAQRNCDLICVHGQTVYHKPPLSWQLMQPAPIAHRFGVPVAYDLRQADLAAGGQGAPLTPIADWVFFDHHDEPCTIVNLGGFCNITQLPGTKRGHDAVALADSARAIRARDVCACNQLLDAIARVRLGIPYDHDGRKAAEGRANQRVVDRLVAALTEQGRGARSLGTGDELLATLDTFRDVPAVDLACSACHALAQTIVPATKGSLFLAGGGAKNKVLVEQLSSRSGQRATTTDELGLPADYREAAAFAVLGALCQDRTPISLSATTGVPDPAPISGAWMHA